MKSELWGRMQNISKAEPVYFDFLKKQNGFGTKCRILQKKKLVRVSFLHSLTWEKSVISLYTYLTIIQY